MAGTACPTDGSPGECAWVLTIFDNLVVARVASLLSPPLADLAKTLFLSLDLFESSVTRPRAPSPARWTKRSVSRICKRLTKHYPEVRLTANS
jgi:hypothetical protein